MDYNEVKNWIKWYSRNKRFVRRIEGEILVINTKYFGARSSSVLGTPGGVSNESVHSLATIGQDKLDELKSKHGERYQKSAAQIDYVDQLLQRLPGDIEEMIEHTYLKGLAAEDMAIKYKCTRVTIYNRINAAIREDCEMLD